MEARYVNEWKRKVTAVGPTKNEENTWVAEKRV